MAIATATDTTVNRRPCVECDWTTYTVCSRCRVPLCKAGGHEHTCGEDVSCAFHTLCPDKANPIVVDPFSRPIIYECGICNCFHPWEWEGDCRDDDNRFASDEYAERLGIDEEDLDIRTWDERIDAYHYCDVCNGPCTPYEDDMPEDREAYYNLRAEEMP